MAIIGHLIGICFFAAIAASGYTLAVQIMYWMGVATMFFIAGGNYYNAVNGLNHLKENKRLPKEIEDILPLLRTMDFDVKTVHTLFANVVHAVIALQLAHAPILGAVIMLASCAGIVTLQKVKEMMKHVENDSRYQQ